MRAPRLTSYLVVLALLVGGAALVLRPDAQAAPGGLKVALSEWRIDVPPTVPAGRVTFEAANTGRVEHELLVLRTDNPSDELPLGLDGPSLTVGADLVLGKPHSHQGTGGGLRPEPRHIRPGETRRDTVTLEPGNYVLLCNLPGHYEAGQRAALRVT